MKMKDLRKKSLKDLEKEAVKLRASIATTEQERFTKDDKNFKKSRNLRRDLARVLTLINDEDFATVTTATKKEDK